MLREMNERRGHGLTVRLLWNDETDEVVLTVDDHGTEYPEVIVDGGSALDAFHHPFLYVTELELQAEAEGDDEVYMDVPDRLIADLTFDPADYADAIEAEWRIDDGDDEGALA